MTKPETGAQAPSSGALAKVVDPEIVLPVKVEAGGLELYIPRKTVEKTIEYSEAALAKKTRLNYESDWKSFCAWCQKNNLPSLPAPPVVVASYLSERASSGIKPGTLTGDLSAISKMHERAGHVSPTRDPGVKNVMKGIRRTHKVKPNKKAPVAPGDLAAALDAFGESPTAIRNRAILLLGFCGAFRRSEIVALNVEDLEFHDEGMAVIIRSSKADQEGKGDVVAITHGSQKNLCSVRAIKAWLAASGLTTGPLFRSIRNNAIGTKPLCDKMVALLVKDLVKAAGLDARVYAGHSLRSGFVTDALNRGENITTISRHCRHKNIQITLEYAQQNRKELFKQSPTKGIGR